MIPIEKLYVLIQILIVTMHFFRRISTRTSLKVPKLTPKQVRYFRIAALIPPVMVSFSNSLHIQVLPKNKEKIMEILESCESESEFLELAKFNKDNVTITDIPEKFNRDTIIYSLISLYTQKHENFDGSRGLSMDTSKLLNLFIKVPKEHQKGYYLMDIMKDQFPFWSERFKEWIDENGDKIDPSVLQYLSIESAKIGHYVNVMPYIHNETLRHEILKLCIQYNENSVDPFKGILLYTYHKFFYDDFYLDAVLQNPKRLIHIPYEKRKDILNGLQKENLDSQIKNGIWNGLTLPLQEFAKVYKGELYAKYDYFSNENPAFVQVFWDEFLAISDTKIRDDGKNFVKRVKITCPIGNADDKITITENGFILPSRTVSGEYIGFDKEFLE